MMIYSYRLNGLSVKTGDILCTSDGSDDGWFGRLWQMIGYLVPGKIDHVIMYIGPEGRCVEAGGRGVIEFTMPGRRWDATHVAKTRLLADRLVGVAYPLQGLAISSAEEERIRTAVATYCLDHIGKPYNPNFLNLVTNEAFYCSQLIYLAYREAGGIDIGTTPVTQLSKQREGEESQPVIVLPTTILENCPHRLVRRPRRLSGVVKRPVSQS